MIDKSDEYKEPSGFKAVFGHTMDEICANCGSTFGSHHGGTSPWPKNYCPGHEGMMDWENGPGTVFFSSGTSVLKNFKELGLKASFHFADDSGKEWNLGYDAKNKALKLFDSYPNLQPQMRKIAKDFLWRLSYERPEEVHNGRSAQDQTG